MSSHDLPSKLLIRAYPRKKVWPVASVKLPESDLRLIDAAAGLLTRDSGTAITRSDVLYTGAMKFAREVLGLPSAA